MCHLIKLHGAPVFIIISLGYHPIMQQFFALIWMCKRICSSTPLSRHTHLHINEWTILYHLEKIHALNKLIRGGGLITDGITLYTVIFPHQLSGNWTEMAKRPRLEEENSQVCPCANFLCKLSPVTVNSLHGKLILSSIKFR